MKEVLELRLQVKSWRLEQFTVELANNSRWPTSNTSYGTRESIEEARPIGDPSSYPRTSRPQERRT